jgi:hypothetical protein
VAALAVIASSAGAQVHVTIDDVGPGFAGRALRAALRQSHRLVEPDTTIYVVPRDAVVRTPLIVLGRETRIEGRVDGDVFVIGANVHVRTGAVVNGRIMAIGGGAYPSTLAYVSGEVETFRYSTFDIARTPDGYRLSYRSLEPVAERPLLFPLFYGLRSPQYDRVNGLTLPFGPSLTFGGDRAVFDVLLTYRSALGAFDPSLELRYQLTRRTRAMMSVARTSATNDSWIWHDLVNSFFVLTYGEDTRNYYRTDRARVTLHRLLEGTKGTVEPYLGFNTERAWSVAGNLAAGGAWSLIGRNDTLGMLRPNPGVGHVHRSAVLAGARANWQFTDVVVNATTRAEASVFEPFERYVQFTSDVAVAFPTFSDHDYALDVHWVTTVGDTPAPQRWAYLGGAGTLPFIGLMSQGGDQLLLVDQRYSIPLERVQFGAFGSPVLQFRHRLGAAGLGGLPALEQMVGFGLSLTIIRGEIQVDPASQRVRASAGFTFSR